MKKTFSVNYKTSVVPKDGVDNHALKLSENQHKNIIFDIPTKLIHQNENQPRKVFEDEKLHELAESIKAQGVIQPIIIKKLNNKNYEIVAGERRWRAVRLIGLETIPAIVRDSDSKDSFFVSLVENIQRENLNIIEEAQALQRLVEEFAMTHEEVAKSIGRSRTMVSNILRLLNLAESVKKMVVGHKLEMGHARALLSLSSEQQIAAAEVIVKKRMTVRAAEAYVRRLQTGFFEQAKNKSDQSLELRTLEESLFELLGMPTRIQVNPKGAGQFICCFANLDKLKNIINRLHKSWGLVDEKQSI